MLTNQLRPSSKAPAAHRRGPGNRECALQRRDVRAQAADLDIAEGPRFQVVDDKVLIRTTGLQWTRETSRAAGLIGNGKGGPPVQLTLAVTPIAACLPIREP